MLDERQRQKSGYEWHVTAGIFAGMAIVLLIGEVAALLVGAK